MSREAERSHEEILEEARQRSFAELWWALLCTVLESPDGLDLPEGLSRSRRFLLRMVEVLEEVGRREIDALCQSLLAAVPDLSKMETVYDAEINALKTLLEERQGLARRSGSRARRKHGERLARLEAARAEALERVAERRRAREAEIARRGGLVGDKVAVRRARVERLRALIETRFEDEKLRERNHTAAERVSWEILPPGEATVGGLLRRLDAVRRSGPSRRYEPIRIKAIMTLKPKSVYVGIGEFTGYVVSCFEGTTRAVLDNPWVGNAIYILGGNWRLLSRLTKRELLEDHSDRVTRIIHSGSWFSRLKTELFGRQAKYGW